MAASTGKVEIEGKIGDISLPPRGPAGALGSVRVLLKDENPAEPFIIQAPRSVIKLMLAHLDEDQEVTITIAQAHKSAKGKD